jgi:hypothetical protein
MALVPLGAFIVFVMSAAGGPKLFMHNAVWWLRDAFHYCVRWVQSF